MMDQKYYLGTPNDLESNSEKIARSATGKKHLSWMLEMRPVLYVFVTAKPPYKAPIFEHEGRACIAVDAERGMVIK